MYCVIISLFFFFVYLFLCFVCAYAGIKYLRVRRRGDVGEKSEVGQMAATKSFCVCICYFF